MLKNSFTRFSASEPGAEYVVFVVFGLVSGLYWTADRTHNDFFNTLGFSRKFAPVPAQPKPEQGGRAWPGYM